MIQNFLKNKLLLIGGGYEKLNPYLILISILFVFFILLIANSAIKHDYNMKLKLKWFHLQLEKSNDNGVHAVTKEENVE